MTAPHEARPRANDDTAAAYAALRNGAMVVDRSDRHRSSFVGAKTADMLTGLVTNDVIAIPVGGGQYAAALTPKGKIIADLRIFRRSADEFFVDTGAGAAAGWWEVVKKFINPRLSRYTDRSHELRGLGVFGVRAAEIVGRVLGIDGVALAPLSDYSHVALPLAESEVLVARVPDAGVAGYELFVPPGEWPHVWHSLVGAGGTPATVEAWSTARVEAGRPEWGVDMDDSTLAQEANLDELQAISYNKGCYTGQETVARVHFRGHVNKHLFGLRIDGAVVPPLGADVVADDKPIGSTRSAALSPRLGAIALAMLRRETNDDQAVSVTWEGGQAAAQVRRLPFPL